MGHYKILISKYDSEQTMSAGKVHAPELKRYMDKKMHLKLNGNREIEGILRGFDPFMNLVFDETIEYTKDGRHRAIGIIAVRGNSVVLMQAKDRIENRASSN